MNLTSQQIKQIDNYIKKCGVVYVDVRTELVDHFASVLENRIQNEPKLDFEEAVIEEHKKFGKAGFNDLIKAKEKFAIKQFYQMTINHVISFFRIPKIIISVAVFFLLRELMNLFTNTSSFFLTLAVVLLVLWFSTINSLFDKKEFLSLQRTRTFQEALSIIYHVFYLIYVLRTDSSFSNHLYNNLHLVLFIISLLFFFCGKHVLRENKKELKKLYPDTFRVYKL